MSMSKKVAVVGINTIFGGTSALLLKQSPFIKCLKLYDQKNVEAAVDLCAINTQCKVKMFLGNEQLEKAFEDADIIVISDESNEAMMSLDSHLMTAAGNYKNYAKAIARASPQAIIVVASTPINCLLPIMSQLLVKQGCYNYNKVVGSTLVDTIRASSMLAAHLNLDPKEVVLPVIGGSSERTRVPIFSQSRPFFSLKKDEKTNLIMNVRRGDVQVLANKGSPEVLNRAYSTVRFLNSIMAGLRGDSNVTDITLCRTDSVPGVDYFSLPVIFGKEGIVKRFGVPKTTEIEDEMVEEAIKHVKKDADKAAYIVRGAIELPEQKYLSSNERASSQKEMFDLYVKCLPKPVDNKQDSMSDCITKKSTNYSFKNLIKDEPSINPTTVPENKTFRRMACDKLKNVASEDSFLKSTGFFTSPLQNPILILEPMVCPSAPRDADTHSELADTDVGDLEVEEPHILHEQNLAKTGKGDMISMDNSRDTNLCMTPTRKTPLSTNEIAQTKTVDPIAKLKDQVVSQDSGKNVYIRPSRVLNPPSSRYENHHIAKTVPDQDSYQETARCDAVQLPATRRSREIEEEIEEEEILSEKEKFGYSEAGGYVNDQADPENNSTSFVYDIRADRALPVYNIYNRKVPASPGTEEEKGECEEIANDDSKYLNPDKDEKYRKLVSRLFRKLDGLNEGMYLPLKSSERCKSRCRQSFTESAVRSKSHWTSNGQLFHSKPPFKIKLAESPFDPEQDVDSNSCQKNLYFKKARKPAPRIKSFISQSTKNTASCSLSTKQSVSEVQDDEVVENNEEMINVVCPKCQNKITCSPDASKVRPLEQKLPKRSIDSVTETRRDPEIKKINISYYGPRPDYSRTYYDSEGKEGDIIDTPSLPVLNTLTTQSKTLRETELQEERLRRLKEKINQKLIPLLNGNYGNCNNHSSTDSSTNFVELGSKPMSSSSCLESYEPSSCEHRNSKDNKSSVGTPFVVGKEAIAPRKENAQETKNQGRTRNSETKWQGIPFVVKRDNEKAERRHKEELIRLEDLKGNEEKGVRPKRTDEQVSAECSYKCEAANKRSAKTANKLQQLGSSTEHNAKPEIQEKIAELIASEKIIKDNKETRLKKEILDLKGEDVQSYMQARINDNFERIHQNKMTADTSCEEKDKDGMEFGEKSETSPESTNKQTKGQLIDSSATESQTKSQSPNQTNQPVTEVGLKSVSSANSKNSHVTDSKRVENKTDNVTSSSLEPDEKSRGDRAGRMREASANSEEEKQKCVGSSPPIDTANLSAESAKLEDHRIGNNSEQTLNQNNGTIDKNVDTTNQSGSKILRNSLVTSKSDCRSKPNSILELIVGKPKSASKLQLLAKARELKLNDHGKSCSINGKLQNIWEQTLNGKTTSTWSNERKSCSKKYRDISDEMMGKKSAAVKIAQGNNVSKPPTFKVKLKAPTNTNILEGLTFRCTKTRRKPTHNLLKEIAASAAQRESRQMAEMIPKKPVRRGRSLDPLNQIHLYKEAVKEGTSFSENLKEDRYFGSRSAEYSRDEDKLPKLASELMMKRKLTRPRTVASKWKMDGSEDKSRINIQKLKRPSSCSSVRNLRNQWADYGIGKDSERESRMRKSADDVLSKLISMPQVRHQTEHSELPLGPLEVQPGLAPLSYATIGSKFPTADNSWESVLFKEYVRSNLLPSLKDTRETFHLEERPS